jgi:hypothetical protein
LSGQATDLWDVGNSIKEKRGYTLECDRMEMVKDNFFKLLVNFLLLTQDDISLALDRSILKLGVLEYVADDVDGDWNVLAEALSVVNGLFA